MLRLACSRWIIFRSVIRPPNSLGRGSSILWRLSTSFTAWITLSILSSCLKLYYCSRWNTFNGTILIVAKRLKSSLRCVARCIRPDISSGSIISLVAQNQGCLRALTTDNRFSGSTVINRCTRSLASAEMFGQGGSEKLRAPLVINSASLAPLSSLKGGYPHSIV